MARRLMPLPLAAPMNCSRSRITRSQCYIMMLPEKRSRTTCLSLALVVALLIGDAVSLASASTASASGSAKKSPPRPNRNLSLSATAQGRNGNWWGRDDQSSKRIACVISTNKHGGHSQAYTFPSASSTIMADGTSVSSTTTNATTTGNATSPASSNLPSLHVKHSRHRRNSLAILRSIQSFVQSTFLPSGFPSKTPEGYLSYATWSVIQDLSTQLRGVVATQRILEGVGVGREGATALSALLNFLVRDGCGMAAQLLFTSLAASKFRTDVKRWRLFADVMVDVGISLEILALQLPHQYFLPMICLGNVCKAICGVAAGACGGAINLHWSKGSDISDINAKFGAQQTVTGSIGLLLSAFFAKSVAEVPTTRLWVLYAALTAIHLAANARCMRLLGFNYLNTVRMRMMVADFFALQLDSDESVERLQLPTPGQLAKREPLWFFPRQLRPTRDNIPILFGVSFDEFAHKAGWTEADLQHWLSDHKEGPSYVVSSGRNKRGRLVVVVALSRHATALQETKAYFHALLLKRRLGESVPLSGDNQRDIENRVNEEIEQEWVAFWRDCAAAGWDLRKSELQSKGYEVTIQYRQVHDSLASTTI